MIRELCPDGVEYVKLGTLCSLITKQTGFDYTNHIKARLLMEPAENAVPYIQTKFFAGKNFNYQTDYYVPMDIVEQFPKITLDEKCILFSIVGASIGNVGLFPGERKCFLGGAICVAKVLPQYDVDYVYYCVESHNVQHQIRRKTKGAGQATITVEDIREFEIPLPPIEIQSEIVHTLDNYTENVVKLQNQLTAELTARQKQYEFYRDKLLTFDVLRGGTINFCQRTLGELFNFRNGLSKGKEFFGKGTPFVRYTDVYNHRTLRKKDITALVECTEDEKERLKVSRGDVLFTRTSETAEDIGWSSVMLDDMDDCVFNGFTIKATPKTKELLPEYCAYCFSTSDFRQYVTKHCAFTTRASLTGNTIAQYRMTIPPLDIQSRIVNVLDNFEKICSDLNIDLPAEIEARQKQYEYYRDKLLTFKEVAAT